MVLSYIMLGAAAGSAGLAGVNAAVAAPPMQRRSILEASPVPAQTVRKVQGTSVRFAAGQAGGKHVHPNPVIGVVTEGSFLFQIEGQPLRVLEAGDGFYEPANAHILHFDNASTDQPAAFTAFYLLDRTDEPLTVMLEQK